MPRFNPKDGTWEHKMYCNFFYRPGPKPCHMCDAEHWKDRPYMSDLRAKNPDKDIGELCEEQLPLYFPNLGRRVFSLWEWLTTGKPWKYHWKRWRSRDRETIRRT